MSLTDSTVLARLVTEVHAYALGAAVRRVVQPRHDLVALELGRAGPWQGLVIDWSAETGRLHLAKDLPAPGLVDHRLGSSLRRHLRGARLEEMRQVSFDRVVHLSFSNCEQLGPESRRVLVCELTGRHGNCVLLDEDGEIIEAGKHVTARVNRYRETLPGLEYVPPPQFDRMDPADATVEVIRERAAEKSDRDLAAWLRGNFHGCSDLFVAEACHRAGLDPKAPVGGVEPDRLGALAAVLSGIARSAAEPGEAYVYWDESGEGPELVWPVEVTHLAGRRRETVPSLSVALERLNAEVLTRREMSALRERIGAAVRQAERKAHRVLEVRQQAIERAADAEQDRARGELLMAWMHQVPLGAEEVTLPGFEGGEVTVPLDRNLSALQNARRYFARYKKAGRLSKLAPRLLAAAQHDLDYLAQVSTQAELAESVADLQRLEEELVAEGYLKPRRRTAPRPRREGPRTMKTADGHTLLYGKSGVENDEVLRAARPDDLWFHVRGAPGSHVVLRADGRPDEVPEAAIYEAATLAARQSSRRRDARVEVDMARAGEVRKPRRGHPGLAYYHADRTVAVVLTDEPPW